ncbi:hypothetical protein [Brevibacillus brevis]|uniref:hypothetical protein n=1 Tax=Brevibacillus brevis TaxID=1393 RepID=UPI0007D8CA19|nr:hypothetical protein [Brevibacillus brevis]
MEKQHVKETDWSKLSDPVKTILERIDINGRDVDLVIGEAIDIPYFKGIVTEEMAMEIFSYQHSDESKEHYSATREGDVLKVKFLRRAF